MILEIYAPLRNHTESGKTLNAKRADRRRSFYEFKTETHVVYSFCEFYRYDVFLISSQDLESIPEFWDLCIEDKYDELNKRLTWWLAYGNHTADEARAIKETNEDPTLRFVAIDYVNARTLGELVERRLNQTHNTKKVTL